MIVYPNTSPNQGRGRERERRARSCLPPSYKLTCAGVERRTEDTAGVRVKDRQTMRDPDADEELYQAWRSQGRLMQELSLKEWVELV